MSLVKKYQALSMNKKILAAIIAGALTGLFFGDLCQPLNVVNSAFIGALQITIVPYLFFSLIRSIGSLSKETASKAAKSGLIILLLFWLLSAAFAWLLTFCLPNVERATFFVPHLQNAAKNINLVDVFIPSNPFHSLSEGYVPAIVLFCFLIGISLIEAKDKNETLSALDRIVAALKRCNNYIMAIMPLGLYLISAYTFGVSSSSGIQEVMVYVTSSIAYNILFTLIILPGLAVCFTRLRYSQIIQASTPALLLSFASGNSFMSLPLAYEALYQLDDELAKSSGVTNTELRRSHIDVFVPLAYIVPASYKFMVVYFVLFSGWFFDIAIPFFKQLSLFLVGIPCLFGSNVLVVPFMLQLANIPSQAFNIFYLTSNILVFFNNANNTMFIVAIVLLWCAALNRDLRLRSGKLALFIPLTVVFSLVCGFSIYFGFTKLINDGGSQTAGILSADFMPSEARLFSSIHAVTYTDYASVEKITPRSAKKDWLQQITDSNELRVGYFMDDEPFCFMNSSKKMVGLDASMMYSLASALDLKQIVFIPVKRLDFEAMNSGHLDIIIGGIAESENRLKEFRMSVPYLTLHTAIMVPAHLSKEFPDLDKTIDRLNSDPSVKIGVIRDSVFARQLRKMFPLNRLVVFDSFPDYFKNSKNVSVMTTSAEAAFTQRILHPGYEIITVNSDDALIPCAFPLPDLPQADNWRDFVDQWIAARKINGFYRRNYDYWISGVGLEKKEKRWSILSEIEQRVNL